MMYTAVISLLAHSDTDPSHTWPRADLRLEDQQVSHQFDSAHQSHWFTITCRLAPGSYLLEFGHSDPHSSQGSLRVDSVRLQGADIGMAIYQGYCVPYGSDQPQHSQQTLSPPGRWYYRLKIPLEHHHRGVGFV